MSQIINNNIEQESMNITILVNIFSNVTISSPSQIPICFWFKTQKLLKLYQL